MSAKTYAEICMQCGAEYTAKRKGSKYCSYHCRNEADKANKRANYVGKREKVCRQCGKELPKYKAKFCSAICRSRYRAIQEGRSLDHGLLKKICPVCGKEFETQKSRQIACSTKCSRTRHQRIIDNMGIIIDYGITLEKLAIRDNNRCQICGDPVDWGDITHDANGNTITGNYYPTIDHIIPKSKGGLHSWNNVQLAHFICNSMKRDNI